MWKRWDDASAPLWLDRTHRVWAKLWRTSVEQWSSGTSQQQIRYIVPWPTWLGSAGFLLISSPRWYRPCELKNSVGTGQGLRRTANRYLLN